MSNLHIPRGQIATLDRVEGSLRLGNNATIQARNGKNVVVTGGVYLEGKAYVNCDLECDSLESRAFLSKSKEFNWQSETARLDLTGRYVGKLEVNGNLTVHKQLNISHSVKVTGLINSADIDVGGRIQAGSIKCNRIRVGGRADIENTFEAQSAEAGGKVVASGQVKLGDLNVGGEVEVGGGSITGKILVGGRFVSRGQLEFGELLVYGKGLLPADCKGRKVSTFGKLEVEGNITCNYVEVGGVIEIRGDCHAEHVEVGGKFEVNGSLFVSDKLEGFGVVEVAGNFESANLRVSGKLTATKITVKEEADISGKTETKNGLKATLVTVRNGSRCEGVLIGERVEVGKSVDLSYGGGGINWLFEHHATLLNQGMAAKGMWTAGGMAKVDDVYGTEVVLGPMCRAGRIFADTVRLERGSAAEQVTYTSELKIDFGAGVSEEPKKVGTLPKPPF
jgi:cytoskeletal protein CcmA (bactofilin family)